MIERSYNGWIASPTLSKLNTTTFEVPGVPGRKFTTVAVAAPLFKYLIRRFNAEVDPLLGGTFDEWSYCYRKARAADALSCHASATAVDLDASEFPMGRQNMTAQQKATVRQILSACRNQFRWGGEFNMPYTDEMHFELVKGTSPDSVRNARVAMFLHDDGRQLWVKDLGPDSGTDPRRIVLLKKALAKANLYPRRPVYNGKWNDRLSTAWNAWRVAKPKDNAQQRLDDLGKKTHLY